MGYTPLEGLVMGTRSGNIDPALALRLPGMLRKNAAEVEDLLNRQSGLLGISGRSADMRELSAAAAAGDRASSLAIEVFAILMSVGLSSGLVMGSVGFATGTCSCVFSGSFLQPARPNPVVMAMMAISFVRLGMIKRWEALTSSATHLLFFVVSGA